MTKLNSILLIDDSEATNDMNTYFIKKLDACETIHCEKNGKDGLAFLSSIQNRENWLKEMPNLILVDIKMPVMDGFEFLDGFEKFPKKFKNLVKICLLTSSMSITDKNKSLQYKNVIQFMNKPIDLEQMKEVLNTHF